MSSCRSLDWSSALRDLRSDRIHLAAVREERLRAAPRPGLPLTAWRGRSGRRYVFVVHDLTLDALELADGAVCAAVARNEAGLAHIVAVTSDLTRLDAERVEWLCRVHHAGASELHVHRLAETATDRAAILADLTV